MSAWNILPVIFEPDVLSTFLSSEY